MSHIELTDLRILQNIRLSDRAYAITTSTEHELLLSAFSLNIEDSLLRDVHIPINQHTAHELISDKLNPEQLFKNTDSFETMINFQ